LCTFHVLYICFCGKVCLSNLHEKVECSCFMYQHVNICLKIILIYLMYLYHICVGLIMIVIKQYFNIYIFIYSDTFYQTFIIYSLEFVFLSE